MVTDHRRSYHISFVCSGNICRSPYAEYRLRGLAEEEGWSDRVEISSAGTLGIFGSPAHVLSIEEGRERGIDVTPHRSQGLDPAYVQSVDLMLGMSRRHVRHLRSLFPELTARFFLLGSYPDQGLDGDDVPDPVGMGRGGYRKSLDLIDGHLRRVAKVVRAWTESGSDEAR